MVKKLLCSLLLISAAEVHGQDFSVFSEGLIGNIQPKGWVKEFLVRQKSGLTGHPEAMAYPYNTCLWNGEIRRNSEEYGDDWWRYEQTAYYTDALLRLGYLLNDKELIDKGEGGIDYTLKHVQSNGRLGKASISSLWPMVVFARAMMADYQYSGKQEIIRALEAHYLSMTEEDLVGATRHILNLEGMLWVYGFTHNAKLLEVARKAYDRGGFELDPELAGNDEYIHLHGVTYAEMLKVPLLLYAYTGEQKYLRLALNSEGKLVRDHMLPDGVYSSAEYTSGKDIDIAHETCDVTDYTWSLGYFLTVTGQAEWADKIEKAIFNAGLGCITKDFKSLQYFSSVNQVIATGNSDLNKFQRGSTWMEYRPTHETECCAGNVNRFMPNYVSRMWLKGKDNAIVAALYGPSSIKFQCQGSDCEIIEQTNYPFDEDITFEFKLNRDTEIPFVFRTPNWCKHAELRVNGKPVKVDLTPGAFTTLKRVFRNGDKVTLTLDMPVEVCDVPDQGVYFMRGPLLYSYAIPTNKVEDTKVYDNMHGKVSENPDFKCWSMTPAAPFGYAVKVKQDAQSGAKFLKLKSRKVKVQENSYPFDLESAPVKITLPVHSIKWDLLENRYNPELPALNALEFTGQKGTLELVPYGCTELRLTVFPWF